MAPSIVRNTWVAPLLAASAIFGAGGVEAASGVTTRYWDCCKPSCAWTGKADVSQVVNTCDIDDNSLGVSSDEQKSSCDGGVAYTCSNQGPWAVNDSLSYGFAAAKLSGSTESQWCCSCYKLTFTSTAVSGKSMIVQITNTGGDLGDNHFDIAMPGGGVGIFNGCSKQWSGAELGNQYGGMTSRSQCDSIPEKWRDGCYWRWDWFENADNPTVDWEAVSCPSELTSITGCTHN